MALHTANLKKESNSACFNAFSRAGFTLVELLVVIGIITILAAAVLYIINPVEQLKKARDSQRISDLNKLRVAIALYTETTGNPIMDNNNNANCSDSSTPRIFVSVPSNIATSSAPGLPSAWDYKQASLGSYRNVDATGWVPINFSGLAGGSPLPTLPVDPINNFSSTQNYFYAYICKSTGQYELETYLESRSFGFAGPYDKTSTDGGRDPYMFETGSNFSLSPLSPVGAWLMDEGSGSYAYDTSGNNNTGTLSGTTTPSWVTSCKEGSCLSFNSGGSYTNYANAGNGSSLGPTNAVSVSMWVNPGTQYGNNPSGSSNHDVLSKGTDATGGTTGGSYSLRGGASASNSFIFGVGIGGTSYVSPTYSSITAGSWYHVVGDYDGAKIHLYVNGSEVSTPTSQTGSIQTTSDPFIIASDWQGGTANRFYNGTLDNVLIYNRSLSSAEILQQYNTLK